MAPYGTAHRLHGIDYAAQKTFLATFCVSNRQPSFEDARLAEIAKEVILGYRQREWYWLLAYAVMPDHIHILLRLREQRRSLSRVIATIKAQIIYRTRARGLSIGFQWGYHDWVLRSNQDPREFAKYVIANPVRARLARLPQDYPYSGIVDIWY